MPDDTTTLDKSKPTKAASPFLDFSSWTDGGMQALGSWTQSSAATMKDSFELAHEMLTFSQARLQANIDAWQALATCRNPADFLECQKEFADKTTAQYLDETNKLTTRVIGIMSTAAAPLRESATKS
jgi:hypothetical protein